MSSLGLSLIVFVFIFGGAIVGMILRRAEPCTNFRSSATRIQYRRPTAPRNVLIVATAHKLLIVDLGYSLIDFLLILR
jgi:hypothetical protein